MHPTGQPHESALHLTETLLCAPVVALSATDGQLRPGGVHGLYRHDRRLLSTMEVELCGVSPVMVGRRGGAADHAVVRSVVAGAPSQVSDNAPKTHLITTRSLTSEGMVATMELSHPSTDPVTLPLRLRVATDLAQMGTVRGGLGDPAVRPEQRDGALVWHDDSSEVSLRCDPPPSAITLSDEDATLHWDLLAKKGHSPAVTISVTVVEAPGPGFLPERPQTAPKWSHPALTSSDRDGSRLLARSLDDLDRLLLADPDTEDAVFLAAGTPWYFTLFGRDALWAARLMLPHSVELAHGTLRALAARQGSKDDADTEEQPGKILHEVRRYGVTTPASVYIPPLYYGTIDATALWICLLHEAWRAGLDAALVQPLLPHLRRALDWTMGLADPDGDGFAEYIGSERGGLVNQGWKDSGDSVQWADGRIATGPIALSEVQGYAYEAAVGGAELLDAFALPGAADTRQWAAALRERFRARYWIEDEFGRYPAIALDGNKQPVTGAASNMGHLLGTGLLDADESAAVAARLARPDLNSGRGLRTLANTHAGFDSLSYHCGSIWPHDNGIVLLGLAAEGHHELARSLAEQTVAVAETFDYRVPELYGAPVGGQDEPVAAYPSSCTPQAWSAAAAVAAVGYLNGWSHTLHPPAAPV